MKNKKPPIGLRPEFLAKEDRVKEIQEAINRYIAAKSAISWEWIEEYNNIVTGKNNSCRSQKLHCNLEILKTNEWNDFYRLCRGTDLILIWNKNYRGSPLSYLTTKESHPHLDRAFANSCNRKLTDHRDYLHSEITELLKEYDFIIVRS